MAEYALNKLGIDKIGLDLMDRKILEIIIDKFSGGPVGLKSLSVAIGEDISTIEEVYEPFDKRRFNYAYSTRESLKKTYNY